MQPLDEFKNCGCLRLQQAFYDQLAVPIHYRNRDSGLMNIHADILLLTHKGAPFARLAIRNNHNLSQKWAPFYIACYGDFSTVESILVARVEHTPAKKLLQNTGRVQMSRRILSATPIPDFSQAESFFLPKAAGRSRGPWGVLA